MKPERIIELIFGTAVTVVLLLVIHNRTNPPAADRGVAAPIPAAPALPVKWQAASYEEGQALAREFGRPHLVVFSAKWCGPCRQLEKTLADPIVANALAAGHVFTKVDGDARRDLVQALGVQAYPTYLLIPPDPAGVTKKGTGYKSAADFARWLAQP